MMFHVVFVRPGFETLLRAWRDLPRQAGVYEDVYDGELWERFQSLDGAPLLSDDHLALGLFCDWFTPFANSPYSVGVLFACIHNLPREQRYRPHNMVLLGVIPGPREPADLQHLLAPLVDELLRLQAGVFLRTHLHPLGRLVRVILFTVQCDLLAARKIAGFMGVTAHYGCSCCTEYFQSEVGPFMYQYYIRLVYCRGSAYVTMVPLCPYTCLCACCSISSHFVYLWESCHVILSRCSGILSFPEGKGCQIQQRAQASWRLRRC